MSWNLAKSQIKVTVKVVFFFLFYFIFLVVKYQTLYLPALCNDFAQSSPDPLFLASPASAVHSSSLEAGFSLKINLRLKLGLGDSGKAFLFFFFSLCQILPGASFLGIIILQPLLSIRWPLCWSS